VIVEASPRAERQIRVAQRWWLQNRDKAPEAFEEDIDHARELLQDFPNAGKPVRIRIGWVRRLTLERIRYYLYYRVETHRVYLLSLWHTSRRPPSL
jgi:plasmid stabilization system protein ParE